ncbi:SdpI family protein [Corynebacterium xerosis]|uniref:SdpI family protein n=1 Tax=Corynebacterium xerosis TaxID=1725 RepID=UPI003671C107
MSEADILGLVMFAVMAGAGLMLIWMARAEASGKLKRNSIAGIRTAKTMASEEAWRAAHVRTKTHTMIAGAVSLIGGVIALLPIGIGLMMFAVMVATGITFSLVTYAAIVGGRAADEVATPAEG